MTVDTRNGINNVDNYGNEKQKLNRENRLSSHLTDAEQRSILAYLKPSAKALCTGVCQLLQAENNIWTDMKVGVICFIRDPHIKEYALSLLLPKPDERSPAKVLWTMSVSAFFETERTSDDHLLTFIMETFPRDVCGLNFYDAREADEFHRILIEENRNRISRRSGRPKRHAPPPPSQGKTLDASEKFNEIPSLSPSVDDAEKKQHRKSFLGGFFTMKKKKKERKKLDISAPTDFQHVEHLGLEELSLEDQETFHHLIKAVNIEPGNEAQMRLIREIVATRGSEVRSSMRIKRNSVRPSETFVRGGTHNTLAESRNSMMVVHKQQRRTPREVKKGYSKRHEVQEAGTAPNQQQSTATSEVSLPVEKYLNPDWGPATRSYNVQSKLHVITETHEFPKAQYSSLHQWSPVESEAPPVPSRVESRTPVCWRNSSPYSLAYRTSQTNERLSRMPERCKSESGATSPIWRIEVPLPSGIQPPSHSPPPTPPSSQPSPVPSPSAAPSTSLLPHNSGGSTSSTPIPLAPPPPPPPPGLLSPAPTPPPCIEVKQRQFEVSPINNDRRSLLEEIQNVDKGKLRHVGSNDQRRSFQNRDSPTGDGGLLSAIQAELDKRREYIATDSDEESDSTDSEWTD